MFMLVKKNLCDAFNVTISKLCCPDHLRDEQYTTLYFFISYDHPTTDWSAIYIPDTLMIDIHAEADGSVLSSLFSVFVADGAITQQESDTIVEIIANSKGTRVKAIDLIPNSWQDMMISEQQMLEDGWISNSVPSGQ